MEKMRVERIVDRERVLLLTKGGGEFTKNIV